MSSLHFKIKNAYGIGKFDATLLFNSDADHPEHNTNIIYAQNGVMKSSFTRTLNDFSLGKEIKDHIFNVAGSCEVIDDTGMPITPGTVISIPSFDSEPFHCEDMSTLLVNPARRTEYDELMERYKEAYEVFIGRLKAVAGVTSRTTTEEVLELACSNLGKAAEVTPESLVHLIRSARDQIENQPDFIIQLPYSVAGSKDAQKFAETNEGAISQLMKAYEEVKASASFMRGEFDTSSAQKLVKEIEKSKFFDVNHDIELLNSTTQELEKVTDIEDLKSKLATDIDIVLDRYPELKTKFNKMISELSTDTRAGLKRLLEGDETKQIVTIMNNPQMYKRRLWWGYIKACLTDFDHLNEIGDDIQERLEGIVEQAKSEATTWDKVVKQFNNRFRNLPYEVEISNKHNVVLKDSVPEMTITYKHHTRGHKPYSTNEDRKSIIDRLSTGERKAFYLLNVMFAAETAQQSGQNHLIVLDDIVDSFDYKNKYAFLEYLYDVSTKYEYIRLIVLTHNFDFFRLLQFRLFKTKMRDHIWFAQKQDDSASVSLVQGGQFNVIKHTREMAVKDAIMWFALIPFARNIVEYKCNDPENNEDYKTLTECLHSLDEAHTIGDVQDIFNIGLSINRCPIRLTNDIENELFKAAESAYASTPTTIIIQQNLVLAMAIRRIAENYMKSKLDQSDIDAVKAVGRDFTRLLFNRYLEIVNPPIEEQDKLNRVNLMVPEHIHVNAFMYEPLIDLSLDELKSLYEDVKAL